jgi:hypothetical protein
VSVLLVLALLVPGCLDEGNGDRAVAGAALVLAVWALLGGGGDDPPAVLA